VFCYRNRNSGQIVESVERRHDLEGVARWAVVEGVEVPVAKGEHVLTPESVREAETPDVEVEEPKKPVRRTRAKKTVDTEVED